VLVAFSKTGVEAEHHVSSSSSKRPAACSMAAAQSRQIIAGRRSPGK